MGNFLYRTCETQHAMIYSALIQIESESTHRILTLDAEIAKLKMELAKFSVDANQLTHKDVVDYLRFCDMHDRYVIASS